MISNAYEPARLARIRRARRDLAAAVPLSATQPTFTLGTDNSPGSSISGSVLTKPLNTDGTDTGKPFRFLGAYHPAYGKSGVDVNQVRPRNVHGSTIVIPPYSVRFGFAGDTEFAIRFKAINNCCFRLRIDDQFITLNETAFGGTAGHQYDLLVSGLDSGPHTYQLDLHGPTWFGGIYTAPTATLWRPDAPDITAVCLSDSTAGGANGLGAAGAFGDATWWARFCQLQGWEAYNPSVGGTGFTVPGAATVFQGRIATDIAALNPDVVIVSGSRNDNVNGLDEVQPAVIDCYRQLMHSCPGALVIALGPWQSVGSPLQGYLDANTAARTAALTVGIPFVDLTNGDVVMGDGTIIHNDGKWITGTGFSGSTTGDGNADLFVSTDDVHPSRAGHEYWARRAHSAVSTIIDAL